MAICGDVPAVEANVAITDLTEANASTDSIRKINRLYKQQWYQKC